MKVLSLGLATTLLLVACTALDGLSTSSPPAKPAPKTPLVTRPDDGPVGDNGRPLGEEVLTPEEQSTSPPESNGKGATWCDTHTEGSTLCADFDGETFTSGFTARGGVHGATEAMPGGMSAPLAFASITEPVGDGVVARAYLRKDFTITPATELVYSFALRLEQIGATLKKGGTLADLAMGAAPNDYELQLNVDSDGMASIMERGPQGADGGARRYVHRLLTELSLANWVTIAVRIDYANNTFSVAVNDQDLLLAIPCDVALPKSPPALFLGVSYVDPPSGRWDVRYDDLLVAIR